MPSQASTLGVDAAVAPPTEIVDNENIGYVIEDDFTIIKHLVTPFRDIFRASLENMYTARLSQIIKSEAPDDTEYAGLTVYTLHVDSSEDHERKFVKPAVAFPPGTSEQVRKAISRRNMCDITVNAFLSRLHDTVRQIGAKADWLEVRAAPLLMLRYKDETLDMTPHSVIVVTTPSGQEFIVDLTIEQFGYDGNNHWFMEKHEYLDQCTVDGCFRVANSDELADIAEEHAEDEITNCIVKTLRAAWDEPIPLATDIVSNGEELVG